jgi:excisionase family DNA binding protein
MDGMTVQEAADYLHIHEKTVRRRIKLGELPAVKIELPQGYEWRVYPNGLPNAQVDSYDGKVDSPESEHNTVPIDAQVSPHDQRMDSPAIIEMVRLVDRLQRDNQQLAGQVGYLQRQVLEQQEIIQRLLAAPREDPEPTDVMPQEAPTQADSGPNWQSIARTLEERVKRLEEPRAEPEPPAVPAPRRSWWHRLLGSE